MCRIVFEIICVLLSYVFVNVPVLAAPPICWNPNGNKGQCISLNDCKSLRYVLRKALTEQYHFVRMSQCDVGDDAKRNFPYVCCTNDTRLHDAHADWQQRIVFPDVGTHQTWNYGGPDVKLSTPPHCGAIAISEKIYGGVEAEMAEFSWLVKLEYRTSSGAIVSECAGSLINQRYVLTAAHCVAGPVEEKIGKLISLRVGEHSFDSVANCNTFNCPARYQRLGIESIVVHERYGADDGLRINEHNDIALIRMDRAVEFDDRLQPVCLPTAPLQTELREGMLLTAAGWGHTGLAKHSKAKQKVQLPLVATEKCRQIFTKYFNVSDDQLCAGGVYREDTCSGDSGGPLMHLYATAWVQEGIVSFGRGCGFENRPGIYTRIRSYLNWIVAHMKPW